MDFMRHIRVPHPFGAASGCAKRISCRASMGMLGGQVFRATDLD